MDFTYSDFWINKCTGYNDDQELLSEVDSIYQNYGYDKNLLYNFVCTKYDFVKLGLNPIYKQQLLDKIKYKINDNTPGKNFISFWENEIIHASIQQLLRKIFTVKKNGTADDLANIINKGYSYCWIFKGDFRHTESFFYSDLCFIDIDNQVKYENLDEVKQDPFFQKYGLIIHPSASHTNTDLRCRVIFKLEKRIYNPDKFVHLLKALAILFDCDTSLNSDKSIYGSNKHSPEDVSIFDDNVLPAYEVDNLIEYSKNINIYDPERKPPPPPKGKAGTTPNNKQLVVGLQPNSSIICKSNILNVSLKKKFEFIWSNDLVRGKNVASLLPSSDDSSVDFLCALHNDTNPSAYIVEQSNGIGYRLGCHVPGCTGSASRRITPPTYREKSSKIPFNGTEIELQPQLVNGVQRLPSIPLITNTDTIQIVRAAKGSGKSFQMEQLCKKFKKQNISILAITHLVSLSKQLSQRFGLNLYSDLYSQKGNYTREFTCTINSLPDFFEDAIINKFKYSVVIVDEFEQVINTLFYADYFSDNRRVKILELINHFVSNAKYVYLLDSDAGKLSKNYANNIKKYKSNSLDLYFYNLDLKYKRNIYICTSKFKVYYEILKAVSSGENIIIVANRRSETSNIFYRLKILYYRHTGKNLSILRIDGSTSDRIESKKFFDDPTNEARKYQVLIYNQKFMTGGSIECYGHFSKVFGIFNHNIYQGNISNVSSNLQMISRYRDLVPVCIYIEYFPKRILKHIKNKISYPGIKQSNLITDTFESFSNDLHAEYLSNIKDYYMEHIGLLLESGYNVSLLECSSVEKDHVRKVFLDNVKIFYFLTEYKPDTIKNWPQQKKDKIFELRRLFVKLGFDIYDPDFGKEILKSDIVSSRNIFNRRIKDLINLYPHIVKDLNLKTNFKKPKYILNSIFKHVDLKVKDRDVKTALPDGSIKRDVGYTITP